MTTRQKATANRSVWLRLDGTEPCRGRADLYFPDRTTIAGRAAIEEAKALCAPCHQKVACEQAGHAGREVDGVWGGVDFFFVYGPEAWKSARRARERAERLAAAERQKARP